MPSLPYDIVEAMIQCFGRAFHYKDPMANFLRSAGVDRSLVDKHRDLPKFVWARNVLTDLGQSDAGYQIQRRLLTELCKLRNVPDPNVPDRNAGLDAIRNLKQLALDQQLIFLKKKDDAQQAANVVEQKAKAIQERAAKLGNLRQRFTDEATSKDRQGAGFGLEDILRDLFALFEIEYTKSIRTGTEQIDGHFRFEGFDYLVEAKWRKDQPTYAEIAGFKGKVDSKFQSTRGLYVSIEGVRPDVVARFEERGGNIIFMDGGDLTCILEGRVDLKDALRFKIEEAAQKGVAYASIWQILGSK